MKKTRQTKEEVGRQHQVMDRPGVPHVPEDSGEQGKLEKTGCKIICGAPTTLAVKGLIMMMMNVRGPVVPIAGYCVGNFLHGPSVSLFHLQKPVEDLPLCAVINDHNID